MTTKITVSEDNPFAAPAGERRPVEAKRIATPDWVHVVAASPLMLFFLGPIGIGAGIVAYPINLLLCRSSRSPGLKALACLWWLVPLFGIVGSFMLSN